MEKDLQNKTLKPETRKPSFWGRLQELEGRLNRALEEKELKESQVGGWGRIGLWFRV